MDIKDFIELFMTTYKLMHKTECVKNSKNPYFAFYINGNLVLEIFENKDIKIKLWIPNEDKMLINMLKKVDNNNLTVFMQFNAFTFDNERYSEIKIAKTESNLEWFNEIVGRNN